MDLTSFILIPVLVVPAGTDLHCRAKDVWHGASRRPSGPPEPEEESIPLVYLLGRSETPRRGPEYRERLARHLLSARKGDPGRVKAFDRDGDGNISLTEWEGGRAKTQRVAGRSKRRIEAEPPLPRILHTDDPHQPFAI